MQNDLDIATRFLFINMAIKVLELDKLHIQNGPFKIKDPYMKLIEKTISKAIEERRQLKRVMYHNKIQVQLLYKQGRFSTYKFILGKKEQKMMYMHPVIKMRVEEVLQELIGISLIER